MRDVSRETAARLERHAALLRKWTQRINLVSRASLPELWQRHIADSMQLWDLAPHPVSHWADLGSGGGFPGLVIAILAIERGSPARVSLVESDQRKAAFLRTAIRETGAPAEVIAARAEALAPLGAEVLSARALADLPRLLGHVAHHMRPEGTALLPKGARWQKEVEAARQTWNFDLELAKSQTEAEAVILRIRGVARV
ncbi:MAG: 16S rRNA (guanine(527)-N(7))-methyltransferase RsmG [Roseovarius sp.]